MIADIAPGSARYRRIAQLLGRVCIARVPKLLDSGKTRLCGTPLRAGHYCPGCMARLKSQQEN